MAITAVGSVALDSITTSAGTAENVLGGSLTYFGFAASLFVPVHLVAVIGDDFPLVMVLTILFSFSVTVHILFAFRINLH